MARSVTVHPTAEVHPSAELGEGVEVGALAFVGEGCVVGAGSRLLRGAVLQKFVELGEDNAVGEYSVLGGDPQDRGYDGARPGRVVIGSRNILREHVTINRSTVKESGEGRETRVGSGCMFMAGSHVGHNVWVGDHVVMANAAMLGGHSTIGDRVVLSGACAVHQFCRIGEGVMFRGGAGMGVHVPPFLVVVDINMAVGLNAIGMRRAGIDAEQREQVKRVFRAIYRDHPGARLEDRLRAAEALAPTGAAARFVGFVREAMDAKPPHRRAMVSLRSVRARSGGGDEVDA